VKKGSKKRRSINQYKGWKVMKGSEKRRSINQYKGWRKWRQVVKSDVQSINIKDEESEDR
jgi:hypothetical protein